MAHLKPSLLSNILRYLTILVAAGILSFSIYHFLFLAKKPKKARLDTGQSIPLVMVETILPQKITTYVEGYGRVRPMRSAAIFSQVTGSIAEVGKNTKPGNYVEKGQFLAQIAVVDYSLEKENAVLEIASNSLEIEVLKKKQQNIAKTIEVLEESVLLAKTIMENTHDLFLRQGASEVERDSKRQSYLTLKTILVEQQNQRQLLPMQIQIAQKSLDKARLRLKKAKIVEKRATISAPFSGQIRSRAVALGSFVTPDNAIFVIDDQNIVEIPIKLKRSQLSRLFAGQFDTKELLQNKLKIPVEIYTSPTKNSHKWQGQAIRIENAEHDSMVSLIVEVDNASSPHVLPLHAGMLVYAKIPEQSLEGYTVPQQALHDSSLYMMDKERLQIKEVKLGQRVGNRVVVYQGVTTGDRVIVSPLAFPVPGMSLKVAAGVEE